jgi:hypothetical protein
MTKNGKIALGCGGAGCLGLIVLAIAGAVIYFMWAKPGTTYRNYNSNINSGNRNSNSNSNGISNSNTDITNSSNSSSSSSMSDDDKHKLYQAALTSGDSELVRRVSVKLGLMDEDFTPGDEYTEFVKDHAIWVFSNTDFIQTLDSKEKAVAYVNQHMP